MDQPDTRQIPGPHRDTTGRTFEREKATLSQTARFHGWAGRAALKASILVAFAVALLAPTRALAELDTSKYIAPEEIKAGMRGYGKTVMAGTKIETFQFEVLSVMRNAFFAKQDIILVRCSGLNLEHSGIIGGMSGSPCYIRDDQGRDRLMGAIAYGWTYTKDPIGGVQPITQMLDIAKVRAPTDPKQAQAKGGSQGQDGAIPAAGLLVHAIDKPLDEASRFSILNDLATPAAGAGPKGTDDPSGGQLRPLLMPLLVSGMTSPSMDLLREMFEPYGLEPIAAGGSSTTYVDADDTTLEPGSALCVPFMTGDMVIDGVGTCTWTDGDKVLGFGHSMFGEGSVELPMGTGFIHTIIPSVARSNKLGGTVKNVGTLWGDENTGIFGEIGKSPRMVPLDVVINNVRGKTNYHYDVVQEEFLTPGLITSGVMESIYAHSALPIEHAVSYNIEVVFEKLGTYRTRNITSQRQLRGIIVDLLFPVETMMAPPLKDKAKVDHAKVEVTVTQGARAASLEQATLKKSTFKPGETVEIHVRWAHYRAKPRYTTNDYEFKLPKDLPDGKYELTIGMNRLHLLALRKEKPYLFYAETMPQALAALNLIASYPDDQLYARLVLPWGGVADKKTALPDLPSFRRQILADSGRSADLTAYTEALVQTYPTPFVVNGGETFSITVDRKADQ